MVVRTSRTGPFGSRAGPASSVCLRDSNDSSDTHAASSAGFRPSHTPRRRHSAATQIELGVQPGEPLAGRGDHVAVQIAEFVKDLADPVEGPRDHVTAPRDLALKLVGFLLLAEVALGVPGVLLAVRARVARMPAEPAAQLGDVPVAGELAAVDSSRAVTRGAPVAAVTARRGPVRRRRRRVVTGVVTSAAAAVSAKSPESWAEPRARSGIIIGPAPRSTGPAAARRRVGPRPAILERSARPSRGGASGSAH